MSDVNDIFDEDGEEIVDFVKSVIELFANDLDSDDDTNTLDHHWYSSPPSATGSKPPRLTSAPDISILYLEEDLRKLCSKKPKNISPSDAGILSDIQLMISKVRDLEREIGATDCDFDFTSIKPTVQGILGDLEAILPRISEADQGVRQLAIDQSQSIAAILARLLFLLPECGDPRGCLELSSSCFTLEKEFFSKSGLTYSENQTSPMVTLYLGIVHLRKFQLFKQEKDIEEAIRYHEDSIRLLPDEHAKRAIFLAWLGYSYLAHFEAYRNEDSLKKGISSNSEALKGIGSQVENIPPEKQKSILEEKGGLIQYLAEHIDDMRDTSVIGNRVLDTTGIGVLAAPSPRDPIACLSEPLGSLPPEPPASSSSSVPGIPMGLPGLGLATGFEEKRFSKANTKTIAIHTQSVEGELEELRAPKIDAEVLGDNNKILQEVKLVDEKVSALEKDMGRSISELVYASIQDTVREILQDITNIMAQVTHEGANLHPINRIAFDQTIALLIILARLLFMLPECDDSQAYFSLSESCIKLAYRYLYLPAYPQHKAMPILNSHWGTLYLQRFQIFRYGEDIKRAIGCHEHTLKLVSNDHPKRAMFLACLGRSYLAQFEDIQEEEDLKRGIDYNSKALKDVRSKAEKAKPEELQHILEGKGRALQCLVEYVGGMNSANLINYGIEEWKATLLDLFKDDETRGNINAGCMKILGFLYLTRFDQLGSESQTDLHRSLIFLVSSLTLLPEKDINLRSTLCVLAHSLVARSSGDVPKYNNSDSALAIRYLGLARSLTPPGHYFEPHLFASYGDIHMILSHGGLREDHLERARKNYDDVLRHPLCRPGSRLWAKARQQIGIWELYKFRTSRDPIEALQYLRSALRQFIQVAMSPRGHLYDRFTSACSWAKCAAAHPTFLLQSLYGYEMVIELVPLLACFGAIPDQRHKATQLGGHLAVEAAATAIEAGDYPLALTLLEQGRSVKWNHILQLQTPLQTLKAYKDSKAQAYAKRLEEILMRLQLEEDSSLASTDEPYHEDLGLQGRYQRVLKDIRGLSGPFTNFMRPKEPEDFVKAARKGPAVVINVHESRCDALIVHPMSSKGKIDSVELDRLTPERAREMQRIVNQTLKDLSSPHGVGQKGQDRQQWKIDRLNQELKDQLKRLWDWVVYPVLEKLKYEPRSAMDKRKLPHITWCATGPLSFLPLHAAGDYDNTNGKKTFDYVVSSYTPTLSALLRDPFYEAPPKDHCGILLVDPGNVEGQSPLPGAKKELDAINKHFRDTTSSIVGDMIDKVSSTVSGLTGYAGRIMGFGWGSSGKGTDLPKQLEEPPVPDPRPPWEIEGTEESDDSSDQAEATLIDTKSRCTRLEGPDATPEAVYKAMTDHDWVHLACHAEQNDGNTARCGFHLAGGLLSLEKLGRMPYKKRGLAFLSACQTAKGNQNLPEEAIHLASGMLMTGYSGVIATMWPVRDTDAPFVADVVYRKLLVEHKLDCTESALALHSALDTMRKDGAELAHWIPFIHYGA
ncbi:Nesprin-2 [Rhizoctonia solani]|uniref:Nesprin-2 n=1 Tax=Rhizoctonia solani TaxID=456999 RepID=A0A0K6GCA3_9AGAM|nr:Nesprin-2 [Rhizoctonia solani]